jgi:hypothetical protein
MSRVIRLGGHDVMILQTPRRASAVTAMCVRLIYAFLDTRAERYVEGALDYLITERNDRSLAIGGMGLYWHSKAHQVMEIGYIGQAPSAE